MKIYGRIVAAAIGYAMIPTAWAATQDAAATAAITAAGANSAAGLANSRIANKVRRAASDRFGGARIELLSEIRWTTGTTPPASSAITVLGDDQKGLLQVQSSGVGEDGVSASSEGWVRFDAWAPAWVPVRRVLPGERLAAGDFKLQEVNVASGMAREYRGVLLPQDSDLAALEARQTLLEGQFVTSSAVQRVPDLRRGEVVRIELQSGGVRLSTPGTSEEPAYLGQQLRVTTQKTKRTLVGTLLKDGVVEVKL